MDLIVSRGPLRPLVKEVEYSTTKQRKLRAKAGLMYLKDNADEAEHYQRSMLMTGIAKMARDKKINRLQRLKITLDRMASGDFSSKRQRMSTVHGKKAVRRGVIPSFLKAQKAR